MYTVQERNLCPKRGVSIFLPGLYLSGGHGAYLLHEMTDPIMKLFCMKLIADLMAVLNVSFWGYMKKRQKRRDGDSKGIDGLGEWGGISSPADHGSAWQRL